MTKLSLAIFAMACVLDAQEVGTARGDDVGAYNITQSFETGYRWSLVGGDLGMYRSVDNYGNGLRLLSSSLSVHSKDGHGRWFDEIVLNTEGLGNDPYQSAVLRAEKNRLYRYDMIWRLEDYYNPGLTVAGGAHLADTSRRLQDHDLTLLPQAPVQFHLGYSRNTEDGPALSTAQEFDANGAAFPVFTNVKRQWNEYRLGADATFKGFRFTVLRRWDFFRDDTAFTPEGALSAAATGGTILLNQFQRSQPVHGSSPSWLGNLTTQRKHWGANARIAYVAGTNDFALSEVASGAGITGSPASRQILVGGDARRPSLAGSLNLSFFPTRRLTLTNNTAIHSNRIDGNSTYSEVTAVLNLGTTINFRYLGVRTVVNSTELDYRATNWIGFYGGYHYSDREVRTVEGSAVPAVAGSFADAVYSVTNVMRSGTAGVRLRPVKPLTISLEGEVGRANQPLTPISDASYHTLGGRADYRTGKLRLSTSYHQVYDVNAPLALSLFSSHSRTYDASASWSPRNWFAVDATYTKLHLDTLSFLAFFAGVNRPVRQTQYSSLYISNIHAANFGTRLAIARKADLYLGYTITRDAGDGRAIATPPGTADPIQALLSSVQTFPLSYQAPLARVSIRITPKIRWNAGWQFYDYSEDFHLLGYYQNFHAHTGYTSVMWAF